MSHCGQGYGPIPTAKKTTRPSREKLIQAIKLAITYLEDGAPNTALERLRTIIGRKAQPWEGR